MDWLSVVIEEYKTLRNESLASMQTQQSILRFGTAAVAVLIATGFSLWEKSPLPEIILLLAIPSISYLILTIWMGEVARMMRAGMFLVELENKINKEFNDKPKALTWEHWLRDTQHSGKTPQLRWDYYGIIALFFLIALGSIVIVNCFIWKIDCTLNISYCPLYIVVIDIFELIFFLGFFIFIYKIGKRFE